MKRFLFIFALLLGACSEPVDAPRDTFNVVELSYDTLRLGDGFSLLVSGDVSDSAALRIYITQSRARIDSVRGQRIHCTVPGDAESGFVRL